jgi:hypothetical protein
MPVSKVDLLYINNILQYCKIYPYLTKLSSDYLVLRKAVSILPTLIVFKYKGYRGK